MILPALALRILWPLKEETYVLFKESGRTTQ